MYEELGSFLNVRARKNYGMESFYMDSHVHGENPVLNISAYDPYDTSQLFPGELLATNLLSDFWTPPIIHPGSGPLYDSLTEQGTLRRIRG